MEAYSIFKKENNKLIYLGREYSINPIKALGMFLVNKGYVFDWKTLFIKKYTYNNTEDNRIYYRGVDYYVYQSDKIKFCKKCGLLLPHSIKNNTINFNNLKEVIKYILKFNFFDLLNNTIDNNQINMISLEIKKANLNYKFDLIVDNEDRSIIEFILFRYKTLFDFIQKNSSFIVDNYRKYIRLLEFIEYAKDNIEIMDKHKLDKEKFKDFIILSGKILYELNK